MNPQKHAAARCRNGENCTGVGCKVSTGKTKRHRKSGAPTKKGRKSK